MPTKGELRELRVPGAQRWHAPPMIKNETILNMCCKRLCENISINEAEEVLKWSQQQTQTVCEFSAGIKDESKRNHCETCFPETPQHAKPPYVSSR